jgi:NitT/TauT family transport system substrate-binding protein
MRTKVKTLGSWFAVILSIAFIISSCKKPVEKKVKLGYVSTGITGLSVQIMQDQAIPQKHGLQIEYIGFIDPSALNNAFVLGICDVNIAAGANVVALARSQGRKIQYFFPTLLNSCSLLVRKDSSAQNLFDLKGKKIGWYGLQSGGGIGFYVLAKKQGLDALKDFHMIDTKAPSLWPLLDKGDVEGVVIYEPFVSRMLATGKFRELLGPFWRTWEIDTGNKMEMCGFAAPEDWLDKNSETAQRLIACWKDVAKYIKSSAPDSLAKYAKFTNIQTDEEKRLGIERIPTIVTQSWEGFDKSISETLKILSENKILESLPEGVIRKIE